MKKKILITGINGFLGSHLSKYLKRNYEIIGLVRSQNNLYRIKEENYKIFSSNENNFELERIFKNHKLYAVIHTATVYKRKEEPLESLFETNIKLPVQLLELSNKHSVDLFFNTDSFFNSEKNNYSYLSDYTLSKKHSLEWIKLLSSNVKTKVINMKIFHMYGENDSISKFVPSIISKLNSNVDFISLTLGEQKRDFIYVKDVVNAYSILLKSYDKLVAFSEFEVGTGKSISIKKLLGIIKKYTNSSTELMFGDLPYREGEVMDSFAKNSSLIEIGCNSKFTSIEEGIKKCIL